MIPFSKKPSGWSLDASRPLLCRCWVELIPFYEKECMCAHWWTRQLQPVSYCDVDFKIHSLLFFFFFLPVIIKASFSDLRLWVRPSRHVGLGVFVPVFGWEFSIWVGVLLAQSKHMLARRTGSSKSSEGVSASGCLSFYVAAWWTGRPAGRGYTTPLRWERRNRWWMDVC